MSVQRLVLEPPFEVDGQVELAATLNAAGRQQRLAWRVPAEWRDALTTWTDPFVIGFAFPMMQAGGEVEVVGRVSPSLLANLETFMDVWQMWSPDRYRPARIWSREEIDPPIPSEADTFVMPFSAGVDSCFTALRHVRGLGGRNTRRLGAGVTMFGFDIQSHQRNARPMYDALATDAARMLASIGVPHVEISGNFRTLDTLWAHSHATHLASGLALFGGRFGGALIPNSLPVNQLSTLWGSHPLTDPMLSSRAFAIVDDGGAEPRWRKCEAIAAWPEAMAGLRVCFGVAGEVGNCGRCEKCMRTALAFRIAGGPPPAGLPAEIPRSAWRSIRLRQPIAIGFWRDLLDGIAARGHERKPWAKGVRRVLRRARRIALGKSLRQPFVPIRNRVRTLFRGTSMSRKQIAATKHGAGL